MLYQHIVNLYSIFPVVTVSFSSPMYEVDKDDTIFELVLVKTGRAAISITVNVQVQNITIMRKCKEYSSFDV